MNIYIFPANPYGQTGYSVAVKYDLNRLKITNEDLIIWYQSQNRTFFSNDVTVMRPAPYALSRVINVLRNYVNCELDAKDLAQFDFHNVDKVFCGEVIFYRALRTIFPDKHLMVRFHNCYSRISDRLRLIEERTSLKFKIQSRALCKLEKEIFKDKNVEKIFISKEDRDYYAQHFGIWSDSCVWGVEPQMKLAFEKRIDNKKSKLIHYGGLQTHKIDSLKWFINDVFLPLRNKHKDLELHLYGKGTESFDDRQNGIFGHGFYDKDDLPDIQNGLYVNPDLLGIGVKMKLLDYFEKGASFITTPYGFEGYSRELIDNKYYFMIEKDSWLSFLNNYFSCE